MYIVLTYLTAYSTLLPLFALVYQRAKLDRVLVTLGVVLITGAATDLAGYLLCQNGQSTISLVKCYVLIESLGLMLLYCFISDHKRVKQFVVLNMLAILFVWCLMWLGWFSFGFLFLLQGLVLMTLACLYFYDVAVGKQTLMHQAQPYFFFINAAILLYFGINAIPFYFEETVRFSSASFRNVVMGIHHFIHLIYTCLLAIGIARKR